ncbi:ubiquitin-protein ligase E3A isoform X2 [Pararge aegeria]|nr:ubiquitin-protein ligase E3A isoform X2 [Pararge aegeria]XP_039746442.1 ubiquitin-protein ligase E3A isoform X2 [Pararge aegeria]
MKRAAAKQLIERYFYQLLDGCGNPNCDNRFCASSGEARNLTPNEAAAEAIKLFYTEARLCDTLPNKVPRTEAVINSVCATTPCATGTTRNIVTKDGDRIDYPSCSTSRFMDKFKPDSSQQEDCKNVRHNNGAPLTEERIYELCDECLETKKPQVLTRALGEAFTQPAILARCFQRKLREGDNGNGGEKIDKKSNAMCSSSDPDKDVDSVAGPGLDVASCRRAFQYLANVPSDYYSSALVTALTNLAENLMVELQMPHSISMDDAVNCFVIAFEVPDLSCSEYLETALPLLCIATEHLTVKAQAKLARVWAQHCKDSLRHILETLQQLITLRVISTNYVRHFQVQDDTTVTMATKTMKIVYYANMLAGVMESNTMREEPVVIASQLDPLGDALDHLYPLSSMKNLKHTPYEDPLAIELDINVLDARKPFLPFEEFYNEPLSDTIEMDIDLANCKTEIDEIGNKFSFLKYPFILTAATKSLGLYYENRIRMYSERRVSLLHAVVGAAPPMPFLRLKVRRSHIIDDALVELEMIAMERALDLKKQLVVEFEGEQGIDEGGVSKEFFQLVVEQIFNPDYGMFTQRQDEVTVWFNPTSFETEAQFTLIGIVLGLAIYNNIILAVNFPMVVYRKLMGKKGSFEDLADWNSTLYNGLKDMLEYTENDLEETYYQTFRICYTDVFGNNLFHDLKENGDDVFVTQENKREFVDLYADFLLNKSVETQFKAFRRGFVMVTDESQLGTLFRPEEVETLVCGSKNFDFNELEKSTEYDGGYTSESQTIKDFWSIVHSLSLEDKRKLLQFTTGSDRVPVGGLSHLKLVIARNGPDCARLPTAHTCFNVLLLPEYENKEKLEDRLMKAISYSKGFGII